MHVQVVTRVHAVTPKLVICVMYFNTYHIPGILSIRHDHSPPTKNTIISNA